MNKLFLMVLITVIGFSASAYKGDIEFKQENGSSFNGNLKGDEWFNWIEDKDGNIIKYNNSSKNYEYAEFKDIDGVTQLLPSGIAVGEPLPSKSKALYNTVSTKDKLSKVWKEKRDKALEGRRSRKNHSISKTQP